MNFTLTNHADHHQHFSHDAVNRYLRGEWLTSQLIGEAARSQVFLSPRGYLVFDDLVLDKNFSQNTELVRRQYGDNARGIIKGIGMVNCLYVNPDSGEYWFIDYRIFEPDGDGKSKLYHVRDLLTGAIADKQLPFSTVLMDTWYATKDLMLFIAAFKKIYYCPIRDNRLVDDSQAQAPYQAVSTLQWSALDVSNGKGIKIKGFPKHHKVKRFRVVVSANRTDWIVTNDLVQQSLDETQEACRIRWKIEQFHREIKQLTGVEKCQSRKARIQRNHIACAFLVWIRLADVARKINQNIYRIKRGVMDNYLRQELKNPAAPMAFA